MASLLYGAGLRLLECARLRIEDVDFERSELRIRDAKGGKARVAPLPQSIAAELRAHVAIVRAQHQADLQAGAGYVELPTALRAKYPNAPREWPWQWVFPATRHYVYQPTGERRRHHLHDTVVQRAIRRAAAVARIPKRVSSHTLRHSFATNLLESGYDVAPSKSSSATATSRLPCSTPTSSTAAPSASAAPLTSSKSQIKARPALSALYRPAYSGSLAESRTFARRWRRPHRRLG